MWNTDPNSKETNDGTTLSESLLAGEQGVIEHQVEEQVVFVDESGDGGDDPVDIVVSVNERQPNHWRDAWAAMFFLGHQVAIFFLAFAFGVPALSYEYFPNDDDGSNSNTTQNTTQDTYYGSDEPNRFLAENVIQTNREAHLSGFLRFLEESDIPTSEEANFSGFLLLCFICSVGALFIAAAAISLMIRFSEQTIQFSLLFSVFCNLVVTILFALQKQWVGFGISALFLVLVVLYTQRVWDRVPFAASNLLSALTAIQTNGGIVFVSIGVTIVLSVWTLVWILALLGVYMRNSDCDATGACTTHTNGIFFVFLLLSYYWTSEVAKNVLHVTTAGTVGTWWFAPDDASTFCSPAISDSLCRATTYSLGSICFGSLLTALLQLLHQICSDLKRRSHGHSIFLCVVEFLLRLLESLVAYFNKWAFIYVGLYGYDYLDSGRKVVNLFRDRGWTTIISDRLVVRALFLVSFVIGALTGCLGVALAGLTNWMSDFGGASIPLAFFVPFFCGVALSTVLLAVVNSAVDTVIVSFAEAPLEFERNHPGLYTQMCQAWRQAYPDEFH